MSENVNIKHIEDSVSNVGTKQICIETGNDSQTGHRMWAGKDSAGNTYKFLGKGKPAYIQNLNIAEFATAGLLRTDAIGDIFGDVNTLGELNTALGGTTIDESTDARPPDPHATDHTDGTDDIQDATALQKGIMTAAQAAQLIQNTSDISTAQSDIATNTNDITTNAGAISVNESDIATNTTNIATNTTNIGTIYSDQVTNTSNIATNTTNISTNTTALLDRQKRIVGVGDSITARANNYIVVLRALYPHMFWRVRAESGRKLTEMFNLLFEGIGLMRWTFKNDFYPWVANGSMDAEIVGRKLKLLQPATPTADYMEATLLKIDLPTTISGYFDSATGASLKIFSDTNANILTTTAAGAFSVEYTPTGVDEVLRYTVVGGTLADPIYLNEFKTELVDRQYTATEAAILWGGINDISADDSAANIIEAMAFCVQQIIESGNTAYVPDIMPFRGDAGWTQAREDVRIAVNEAKKNMQCIRMDSPIIADGQYLRTVYTDDGLHPSELGYQVLAGNFAGTLFGSNKTWAANATEIMGAPFTADTELINVAQKTNTCVAANQLLFNSDLTNDTVWENEETFTNDYKSIVSSVNTILHRRKQDYTFLATNYIFSANIKGLRTEWAFMYLFSGGSSRGLFINTVTMEVGTVNANVVNYTFKKIDTDTIFLKMEITAAAGAGLVCIAPAVNGVSPNYAGNGTSVDIEYTDMMLYPAGIGDDIWPASTREYVSDPHLESKIIEDYTANHSLGLVRKADKTWDLVANIDGDEMDESPTNVAVMHAAGVYKVVSDNTWGPLVAGTQFYAPSGNFLELFEDTSIASGAHTLTPSATPPTDNLASPIHSTGTVYHANYAVMVPSYTSATTFSGLKNNGTEMQLVFSTDGYTTALGYRIEVEYEWRAIAPPA